MIVPMKKITLLCVTSAREQTLEALRRLGVLHLEHVKAPAGADLEGARADFDHVRRALEVLTPGRDARPSGRPAKEIVEDIWALIHHKRDAEVRREELNHERRRLEPYGCFDPATVLELAQRGIMVKLCQEPRRKPAPVPDGVAKVVLAYDAAVTYFVLIGQGDFSVEAQELQLPERSLGEIYAELAETETLLEEIEKGFASHAGDYPEVARMVAQAEEAVEYLEAREGMGSAEYVAYLQGYAPAERVPALEAAAEKQGWGLVVGDPEPGENVPTLLRPSWWARPIKALYDMFGITPGYDEVDISPVFLVFFSIFFGMLVGDAGYGLVFLAATFAARRRLALASPPLFGLLIITSVATVAWGVVTGTYFGAASIPAPLRALRIAWLGDTANMMNLCFLIGAVHLTAAHAWKAWLLRRSPQSLAHAGWIASTWGMYFVARNLILEHAFPSVMKIVLGVGVLAVALFMTPVRKLKSEWFGHALLPLTVIGNFVDVVSYVRLFAVGSATLAVASAFNEMLLGQVSGIVSGVLVAVVLFACHALNIGMALLGVMVHGVRLNTLEFSQHMEITWKGFPYNPFARRRASGGAGADAAA